MIVDVANVVGSRPDGWWRDRPGAARRLHDQVLAAALPERVVLVVEGAAKPGVAAGEAGGLRVVHAAASGDDAVVEEVGRATTVDGSTTVVTSDRELRRRVTLLGAEVVGPHWLLSRLP